MKLRTSLMVLLVSALWMNAAIAGSIHIVALGASGTYGKNLMRGEAYPAQLEVLLKTEGYDVEVKNAGVNGNTTGDMLGRLDSDIPVGTNIVIFTSTLNDNKNNKKMTNTKQNIETIAKRLLDRNIQVIFAGGKKVQKYVEKYDILTINGINELGEYELQGDGEHLTPHGYHTVAEKMLPLVKILIAKIVTK